VICRGASRRCRGSGEPARSPPPQKTTSACGSSAGWAARRVVGVQRRVFACIQQGAVHAEKLATRSVHRVLPGEVFLPSLRWPSEPSASVGAWRLAPAGARAQTFWRGTDERLPGAYAPAGHVQAYAACSLNCPAQPPTTGASMISAPSPNGPGRDVEQRGASGPLPAAPAGREQVCTPATDRLRRTDCANRDRCAALSSSAGAG